MSAAERGKKRKHIDWKALATHLARGFNGGYSPTCPCKACRQVRSSVKEVNKFYRLVRKGAVTR
jgi:hypothetical protein